MSKCKCGGKWMYSLSAYDDSGCPTCGVSIAFRVTRECVNCRVPQPIVHTVPEWDMPQEFSSPEFDVFFQPRWDAELPLREHAAEQARIRREKEERYQRTVKAAESFIPKSTIRRENP